MSATPPPSAESVPPGDELRDELRDEIAHLQDALHSQRAIGVAVGLLSATYRCSTEQAWRLMLRVSQDSNTKVRSVARTLVAVHDGTADEDDHAVLRAVEPHLPPSGWTGETTL